MPQATSAQFVPEESIESEEDDDEREDGIFGVTPAMVHFTNAYNTLRELDPANQALQNKYSFEDIAAGTATDDMEAAIGPAAVQRANDFLMPNGQPLGQLGKGWDVQEMPGGRAGAQAAFNYLTVGARDITPLGYPGKLMALPGYIGTIGLRLDPRSGPPALDINLPDVPFAKIHYLGD